MDLVAGTGENQAARCVRVCAFLGAGLETKTGRIERGVAVRGARGFQLDRRELELESATITERVRSINVFIRFRCFVFVVGLPARAGAPIAPAPAGFAF